MHIHCFEAQAIAAWYLNVLICIEAHEVLGFYGQRIDTILGFSWAEISSAFS